MCIYIEQMLPAIRMGNTLADSPTKLGDCIEKFDMGLIGVTHKFVYVFPVNYTNIQASLAVHIARKSAVQDAFATYGSDSMGMFAGFIMHAYYMHHSSIRFHVMQFFEDQLHANYVVNDCICWERDDHSALPILVARMRLFRTLPRW